MGSVTYRRDYERVRGILGQKRVLMYAIKLYKLILGNAFDIACGRDIWCGHLYRHSTRPEHPVLHSPARILSCGKESHATNPGQPHGLAAELVEGFRMLLRGGTVAENLPESFEVVRACPHGYGGRHWRRFCLTTIRQQ